MTARTAQEWKTLDKQVLWHPFTQMQDWVREDPLIVERAEGFHLIDVDGKRYIDGHSSLWVNVHGHGHPRLVEAIAEQARRLDHSTLLGLGNTPSVELAHCLVEATPEPLNRVFYSDSGSTAMEIALKIAFQYWQHRGEPDRRTFITFEGAYHGDTIGSVSLGAIDLFHARFGPLLFDTVQVPWPRPYWDDENGNDPERSRDACLEALDRALAEHGDRVVGVSAEPGVQGASGMHVAPEGFLVGVEARCREHGVLFLLDEVATGFCRSGRLFAMEREGVAPDLVAMAKGITGGTLPLAATLVAEHVYEAYLGEYAELKHFFHGHTYTGNPIACAAAIANLDLIEESGLLTELPERVARFAELLAPLADHPHVGEVRQYGMMVGVELVADEQTREGWPLDWKVPQRVTDACRRRGAVIRPLGNAMILVPPPAMPEALLAELVEITHAAIDEVTASPEP